jgi:hypothetical protein
MWLAFMSGEIIHWVQVGKQNDILPVRQFHPFRKPVIVSADPDVGVLRLQI